MPTDWRAAGRRIHVERSRRWPTRGAFAEATGLSRRVLEDLEAGRRTQFDAATLAAVEHCLGWEPDTIVELANGAREPRYGIGGHYLRVILDAWPNLDEDSRRLIAGIAEERTRADD